MASTPTRLRIAALAALGVACGSTPTRPETPVSPLTITTAPAAMLPLTGTWNGFLHITSCVGCVDAVNRVDPFTLTLTESGTTVTGQFAHGIILDFKADVSGTRQPDGSVTLIGKTVPPHLYSFSATITALRITRDASHGVSGSLAYTDTSPGNNPTQTYVAVIDATSLGNPAPAPAASLAGAWSGTTSRESCSGPLCGSGNRPAPVGAFEFVVLASQPARALLTFDPILSSHTSVEMTGAPQPDGSTLFSGAAPAAGTQTEIGLYEVPLFQVSLNANGGLTGRWTTRVSYGSAGTQVSSGQILSGSPIAYAFLPGSYQGAWEGAFVIRSCTGECDLIRVGSTRRAHLDLSDSGATLSGAFNAYMSVFVTGPAFAGSATLAGDQAGSYCGPDDSTVICRQTVRRLSVSLDEFGRMVGSLELFVDQWGYGPRQRFTLTGDLWSVVRVP